MGGKQTVEYPEWVERYRGAGRTIRKVNGGYGLFRCTTQTLEDGTRKPVQEYLGKITEADGFVPKKGMDTPPTLEYGLSHVIWMNYGNELTRRTFLRDSDIAKLGVLYFLAGRTDEYIIRSSYLTYSDADHLTDVASKVRKERIEKLAEHVQEWLQKKIPDRWECQTLVYLLLRTEATVVPGRIKKGDIPKEAMEILDKYRLHY